MTHRLTASKAELAASCPPSHSLDWFGDVDAGEAAERGSGIHLALEKLPEIGMDAALALIPAEWHGAVRAAAATPALAELLERDAAFREVALQWHPATDTADVLAVGQGRAYGSAAPGAVVGTADILAVRADHVAIYDIKTGRRALTEPRMNMQLRLLALAACRAYGRDRAIVGLIYVKEDEDAWISVAEFDALDLAEIAEQFRSVLAAIDAVASGAPAKYTRGDYCHFCPAKQGCPAWVGLVKWVTKDVAGLKREVGTAISTGDMQAAYVLLNDAKTAVGMGLAELNRMAYAHPISLGEGRYFGLASGKEMVTNADKVHEVLTRELGPEAAELAITVETTTSSTKGQINAALKSMPIKDRARVWDVLRAAGTLTSRPTVRECKESDLVSPPIIDTTAEVKL